MKKRHRDDPFPTQGRYRRVDPVPHDPLEIELAKREAEEQAVREAIANGDHVPATPEEMRGVPIQAKGVGGTSPGTDPALQVTRSDHRLASST